jgi:hypothetical protein
MLNKYYLHKAVGYTSVIISYVATLFTFAMPMPYVVLPASLVMGLVVVAGVSLGKAENIKRVTLEDKLKT